MIHLFFGPNYPLSNRVIGLFLLLYRTLWSFDWIQKLDQFIAGTTQFFIKILFADINSSFIHSSSLQMIYIKYQSPGLEPPRSTLQSLSSFRAMHVLMQYLHWSLVGCETDFVLLWNDLEQKGWLNTTLGRGWEPVSITNYAWTI